MASGRKRRAHGTGSIYESHGKFVAKAPGAGNKTAIGYYDTYEEADAAIETWLAERELRDAEAAERGELEGAELARVTKLINAYLDAVEEGEAGAVAIGALPGFPSSTRDPEVVMRAAKEVEQRVAKAKSGTERLRAMQRVRDLKRGAERLRTDADQENRQAFIEYGAAWAARYGVEYGTFRDAGVPAGDLKEAGITRSP